MHSSMSLCASLRSYMYDALDAPGGVDVELGLGRVELERAALVARLEQRAIHVDQRQ